jgi:hypothetical protein
VVVVVALVALAVVVWQVVGRPGGGGDDPQPRPTSVPTVGSICPPQLSSERAPHPQDYSRVYGGALSYPRLGPPWSNVDIAENRVPFGRDTAFQSITVHANYEPAHNWIASVLVGELYAGDGFYTPEEASEIVTRCIVRSFYGDAAVTREDVQNKAISLDGRDGWLVETNLHFDIPGLPTKSEWVVIAIIATSDLTSSLFYASIPEDAPQAAFTGAEMAFEDLRVEL